MKPNWEDPLVPFNIEVTQEGTGRQCATGEKIKCNYTGMLTNGKIFDSSLDPGRSPFEFTLGVGQVIKCWDKGLSMMNEGEKARLTCPYDMAYGKDGRPPVIPPQSTLIFDVELIKCMG